MRKEREEEIQKTRGIFYLFCFIRICFVLYGVEKPENKKRTA